VLGLARLEAFLQSHQQLLGVLKIAQPHHAHILSRPMQSGRSIDLMVDEHPAFGAGSIAFGFPLPTRWQGFKPSEALQWLLGCFALC
jgi:hypothetical protein